MYLREDREEKRRKFAERLRELRLSAGYKQEDIAKILAISRSAYTYYENALTAPDVFKLHDLAKFYGISMDAFFTE